MSDLTEVHAAALKFSGAQAGVTETLEELRRRLIPAIKASDVLELEAHIRSLQTCPPPDFAGKQRAVASVNAILIAHCLRLDTEMGLARLYAKNVAKGGLITLALRGGSRGGFRDALIKILSVPSNYLGAGVEHDFPHRSSALTSEMG